MHVATDREGFPSTAASDRLSGMNPWITRTVLAVAANGILLAFAALLFDNFELDFFGWLIGTVLFTVFTVALRGVATSLASRYASGFTWVGGLALTWLGLLLTDILTSSDDFYLEKVGTWIMATVVVWIGTVIYDQVDERLISTVQDRLDNR